jgi:hypothetical protein
VQQHLVFDVTGRANGAYFVSGQDRSLVKMLTMLAGTVPAKANDPVNPSRVLAGLDDSVHGG